MKRREPVSHIMTKNVVSVEVTTSLKEIKHIIEDKHIRHIPVLNGDKVVGIISKTDYLQLTLGTVYPNQDDATEALMEMFKLEDLMVKDPICVQPDTTIREVTEIFILNEFHALPVTENDKLVGIVSVKDVLKFLDELYYN